jgi:phosphoserine phosphatase RsbU/P
VFQLPTSRDFALRALNLIDRFPAGPFAVSANTVSGILSTVTLAVIILLRSNSMVLAAGDALGRTGRRAAGATSAAAGGDRDRARLPDSAHGRCRAAGGGWHVAGKGLPAAMLVSFLVGATRGVAVYTRDPSELLAKVHARR